MIVASVCIVLAGSLAKRPVNATDGLVLLLDTLYPMAISPAWSIAMLLIQRNFESGAKVLCWATVTVPLGFCNSYQRMPPPAPAVTAWFTTSDSWFPKLR